MSSAGEGTGARAPAGPQLRGSGGVPVVVPGGLASAVVRATTALVLVIDTCGRIVLVNPAMETFTGLRETDLLGRPFWEVHVVPGDVAEARRAVAAALTTGTSFLEEGDWVRADGAWRRVAMQNSVVTDEAGQPCALAVVATDVTEQRRREARAHREATTDALTGTWNRRALFDALQVHLHPRTGTGCTVLFCDVDDFKGVNDVDGHTRGDQLLVEVAARLREVAGSEGMVARFGGDEFVVLLPGPAESEVPALVERVQQRMRAPVRTDTAVLAVGVSVGGARGHPGQDPDDVLAFADRSMYLRKTHRHHPVARRP